jgi:hypothetical protein
MKTNEVTMKLQNFFRLSVGLVTALIFITSESNNVEMKAFGQGDDSEPKAVIDWTQVVSIVAPTSIATALLSAWLNHYFTLKRLRVEYELDREKKKGELQTQKIEDRKTLYSGIKFIWGR